MNQHEIDLQNRELDIKEKELALKDLERKNARERFWIGSVAVVLITTIINSQIQHRQLEQKRIEQDNIHLTQFVDKIVAEDVRPRLYIADYFSTLSATEGARDRWQEYHTKAQNLVIRQEVAKNELIRAKIDIRKKRAELLTTTDEVRADEILFDILKVGLDVEQVEAELNALAPRPLYSQTQRPVTTTANYVQQPFANQPFSFSIQFEIDSTAIGAQLSDSIRIQTEALLEWSQDECNGVYSVRISAGGDHGNYVSQAYTEAISTRRANVLAARLSEYGVPQNTIFTTSLPNDRSGRGIVDARCIITQSPQN